MQELKAMMTALGFNPPSFELDGKIHRFEHDKSKDAGWYIGWRMFRQKDATPYEVCEFGSWKTREQHTYKPSGKISREDNAAIKAQLEAASKKQAEEKLQRQKEASDKAERRWLSAGDVCESPYLERKLITSLYGAKTFIAGDGSRGVLIPMRDINNVLCGLQTIYPDGAKRFTTGQRVDGTYHTIGNLDGEEPIAICEGFATGASLHQALGYPVVVAFNAGNLASVALEIRKLYRERTFIICGDDDRWNATENVGRVKAAKAGMLAQAAVVFPTFADLEGKPKDFNDLYVREGADAVKALFETAAPVETGFIPLGTDGGTDYYYVRRAGDIVEVTSYSDVQLLRLAPLDYWEGRYPSKTGVAWQAVKSDLVATSQVAGKFDGGRVRGSGVWRDGERIVVNTGNGQLGLLVDGKPTPLGSIDSWYIYVRTKKHLAKIRTDPLTAAECWPLTSALARLKWRNGEQDAWMIAGWLAIARVAGALPIRPHIWVTGAAGTGKSTVMDFIVARALGGPSGKIYVQGSTTEAGIRQDVKISSIPLIFDEIETNGYASAERVNGVIELLRQTWSQTQGSIVKGGANGAATHYQLSFAGLVSSIRVALDNDADRSRFTVLELEPHNDQPGEWAPVLEIINLITEEFGERLLARSCALLPVILESQRRFVLALVASGCKNRMAQQYGMLLAGHWSLRYDDAPTTEQAIAEVAKLRLDDQKSDAELTDEMECLNFLLTNRVRIGHYEKTILEIILGREENRHEIAPLKSYGVIVGNDGSLKVANSHAELRRIFASTRWANNWRASLLRIKGANRMQNAAQFGDKLSRCVSIPAESILAAPPPCRKPTPPP